MPVLPDSPTSAHEKAYVDHFAQRVRELAQLGGDRMAAIQHRVKKQT